MGRIFTVDFTSHFIDAVADYLLQSSVGKAQGLERLAVVFGGKRPAYFLKRLLSRRIGKGFVPPRFFTIDEFMDYTANLKSRLVPGRELDRCFLLYRLAGRITPGLLRGRESFARFLPWAREILDFIELLDLEDIDQTALLSIQQNARIGYAVPDSINQLLGHIKALREAFHHELHSRGETYRGLQYLRASEQVGQYGWSEFDEIVFCNLFYFHRTEEDVVRYLNKIGKASLIFQGDQRKWPVLQRIAERFDCPLREGDQPTPTNFKLHLHAGFDVHSQVAIIRDILTGSGDPEKTVVVLPDAGHVVPLLSEFPAQLSDINVSMGYPLQRSSLAFLLDFVMKAQLSRKGSRYYARDYLRVLGHPFIKNLRLEHDGEVCRAVVHGIEAALTGKIDSALSGSSFIELSEVCSCQEFFDSVCKSLDSQGISVDQTGLVKILATIHKVAFQEWESVRDLRSFAEGLGQLLDLVVEKSPLKDYPLNIRIASSMYDIKEEFASADFGQELFAFDEMVRILEDKLSRQMVHFSGTPLKGLQVLGLFETRSLNFDRVIIMDANEGVLPKLEIRSSLVPREVMLSLKLDRLELEEEIQRYQFMRIISSAKEVHLVYQERADKERSRFIEELAWETDKKVGRHVGLPVSRSSFTVQVESAQRRADKTPAIMDFLRTFRFSASSINLYVRNPYEFYTRHILGLKEDEDLLDEPDSRRIGTFLHDLLKELYTPLLGKPFALDREFERRLVKLLDERFQDTFARSMRADAFLLKAVIEHRLKVFLEKERETAEQIAEVLFIEQPFETEIVLNGRPVRFHCIVDRVDRLKDGSIVLIDYKSGSGDKLPRLDIDLSQPLSRERVFREVQSFQLPVYHFLIARKFPQSPIRCELLNLRESRRDPFPKGFVSDHEEFLQPYIKSLEYVIAEIFAPSIPFVDDDLKKFY